MPWEFDFVQDGVYSSNLESIALEQGLAEERRALEIADLADSALDLSAELNESGLGSYEILSMVSQGLEFGRLVIPSDLLPENTGAVSSYLVLLGDVDRCMFADFYVRGALSRGIAMTERDLLHTLDGDVTFIYSRNAYADEAYDVFSQDFTDPRIRYGKSFAECVSAVTDGDVRFCLLPLEEKGGVRLPTVFSLVIRDGGRGFATFLVYLELFVEDYTTVGIYKNLE